MLKFPYYIIILKETPTQTKIKVFTTYKSRKKKREPTDRVDKIRNISHIFIRLRACVCGELARDIVRLASM